MFIDIGGQDLLPIYIHFILSSLFDFKPRLSHRKHYHLINIDLIFERGLMDYVTTKTILRFSDIRV